MAIRYQNCPWLKRESGQDTSESVYRMAAAELRAEKAWATEETERIEGAIAAKNREFIVANIKELSGKVWHRLSSAGFVEWGRVARRLVGEVSCERGKVMLYINSDALVSGATVTIYKSPGLDYDHQVVSRSSTWARCRTLMSRPWRLRAPLIFMRQLMSQDTRVSALVDSKLLTFSATIPSEM
jgi:hypothetical protein